MATWKKVLVEGDVASDFHIFADVSARNSAASSSRKEGYLAYTKSNDELRVYKSTDTGDNAWETGSNWLLVPHNTDEYGVVSAATLVAADDDKYFFQLYDVASDTYKKLSQNDFFGWFTTAFAQVLIDQGLGSVDTYSAPGSNILGDINGDGEVTTLDLIQFLSMFGTEAGFTIDWVADFQSDGSAVNFTGLNDTDVYKKLTFEASDLTNGISSTGIGHGFNDANDYLTLEDGSNFTLSSNLLGVAQIPDVSQATIKLNILKTVPGYSFIRPRIKIEFVNNGTVAVTTEHEFSTQVNTDESSTTWEYSATEDIGPILNNYFPDTYDEIRLTIEAKSGSGTDFINIKAGTKIEIVANN